MDTGLKERFEYFCAAVGMNMATAFNLFAHAALRERRIPFDISSDAEIPNAETIEAMEEVEQMIEDPSLGKAYTDVDKMMQELLA